MDLYFGPLFLPFFNGAAAMAALVASMFFLRFWRTSADRFFSLFSFAFLIFAIERVALLASNGMQEADPSVYLLRCVGFCVIIFAVIDKNRKPKPAA